MRKFLSLICVYCLACQVSSQNNTLKPAGDKLNSSSQLLSSMRCITLRFINQNQTYYQTNNSYLVMIDEVEDAHQAKPAPT